MRAQPDNYRVRPTSRVMGASGGFCRESFVAERPPQRRTDRAGEDRIGMGPDLDAAQLHLVHRLGEAGREAFVGGEAALERTDSGAVVQSFSLQRSIMDHKSHAVAISFSGYVCGLGSIMQGLFKDVRLGYFSAVSESQRHNLDRS